MKDLIHYTLFSLLILSVSLLASCSENEPAAEAPIDPTEDDKFVLSINMGQESAMLVAFDSFPSGDIDPSTLNGIAMNNASFGSESHGDAIYYGVNPAGDPGIQKYEINSAGQLASGGFIAGAEMFGLVNENKGYYFNPNLSDKGLQIFDPTSMVKTGEIDLTEQINTYAADTAVKNVTMAGFMKMANDKFYAQVRFDNANGFPIYDSTFVLVIDPTTDSFVDWAVYPEYFLFGYFGVKSAHLVEYADDGYLYLSAFMSDFVEGPNSTTVRIKGGETTFDPNFKIDYNQLVEGNAFILGGGVYHNGKLYAKVKPVAPDWSNSGDVNMYPYEVDVASGQITKIDNIPVGTWGSVQGPFTYNGMVYIISSTADGEHYYSYDQETKATEKVFSLTAGVPTDLYIID
ncbi:MAG: hypothetical protein AAF992_22745 [Bacteroidota bacterium]